MTTWGRQRSLFVRGNHHVWVRGAVICAGISVTALCLAQESLSLGQAVRESLQNSPVVARARAEAAQALLAEPALWALTDPRWGASYDTLKDNAPRAAPTFEGENSRAQNITVGVSQNLLPGTALALDWTQARLHNNASTRVLDPTVDSRLIASVRQPLLKGFWGRPDKAKLGQARAQARRAQTKVRQAEDQVALALIRAFADTYFSAERLKVVDRALASAERLVRTYQEKRRYGLVEVSDLIQADTLLETQREEKTLGLFNQSRARIALWARLGRPGAPGDIGVAKPDIPSQPFASEAEALAVAREARWELAALRAEVEEATWRVRLARLDFLPDVALSASWGIAGLDRTLPASWGDMWGADHRVAMAGLSVSMPFRFKGEKVNLTSGELAREAARQSLREAEEELVREVGDAWARCREAEARGQARARILGLEKRKLQAEEKAFQRGRSTTDMLVRFQQDLERAEGLTLTAEAESLLAVLELARVTGTLQSYVETLP